MVANATLLKLFSLRGGRFRPGARTTAVVGCCEGIVAVPSGRFPPVAAVRTGGGDLGFTCGACQATQF